MPENLQRGIIKDLFVKLLLLLYIELFSSFLIGRKPTVNFRNQRP